MKDKILKILKDIPAKMNREELIKLCIDEDLRISDFLMLYEAFYTLVEEIFEVLEEDQEDAKTENNTVTDKAAD